MNIQAGFLGGMAVVPVVSNPLPDISLKRQMELLSGLDPRAVLQAASMTLLKIEAKDTEAVYRLMNRQDARLIRKWAEEPGKQVAPQRVQPLALLTAMRLALANAVDGKEVSVSDNDLPKIAELLLTVAVRWNGRIDVDDKDPAEAARRSIAVAGLWREASDDRWCYWTADLLKELLVLEKAADLLAEFKRQTGLTVEEWFYRSFGEVIARQIHGTGSLSHVTDVEPGLEECWQRLCAIDMPEVVGQSSGENPESIDPFNLSWLALRPVVRDADGSCFSIWVGAMIRQVFPAGLAQILADQTKTAYDECASHVGRAAEARLNYWMEALSAEAPESRISEASMNAPEGQACCDYLLETASCLVGVEFTIISPSLRLAKGDPDAVAKLEGRILDKVKQIYDTLRWRDPGNTKRWLPLIVLVSPSAVDPLTIQKVHDEFIETAGADLPADSELMTCHAVDFLDLLEAAKENCSSLSSLILDWRDGVFNGYGLDFWLANREGWRRWLRNRGTEPLHEIGQILKRSG